MDNAAATMEILVLVYKNTCIKQCMLKIKNTVIQLFPTSSAFIRKGNH